MEPRKLERGELTRIIIGTVCCHDEGITAPQLTAKLQSWGIRITENHARTRLVELARKGRIDRIRHGVYRGV